MDRKELKEIVMHPDRHPRDVYAAAVAEYYPHTTHAPPRLPPDNSPTPDQILRYPKMYGPAKVAEAKATIAKESK